MKKLIFETEKKVFQDYKIEKLTDKKMVKTLLALFLNWILIASICSKKDQDENSLNRILKQSPPLNLRSFNIFANWKQTPLQKAETIYQKFLKQLEKQEIERRILEEEANRIKIYDMFLLKFQGGSSVLKDILTNRF